MMNKNTLKIFSETLINKETELHYVWHKSISNITQKHTHNFYELFLITDGIVKHLFNGKSEIISDGTLVFIRPKDIHAYETFEQKECSIINIAFPIKTFESLIFYLGDGYDSDYLINRQTPPSIRLSKMEKSILIKKISEFDILNRSNHLQIRTKLRILLFEIFTTYFKDNKVSKHNDRVNWLYLLRNEMLKRNNFVEGFSAMQRLSEKSKEHISREFKKCFNLTPTEFINDLRLNYAANLLTNSDENIISISYEVGFENLSHFYHLFKKKFNLSPLNFRKLNKKTVIPF